MSADPMAGLHDALGLLDVRLARWQDRDAARDKAAAWQAASGAVECIDDLLRQLHALRAGLVAKICACDDAADRPSAGTPSPQRRPASCGRGCTTTR